MIDRAGIGLVLAVLLGGCAATSDRADTDPRAAGAVGEGSAEAVAPANPTTTALIVGGVTGVSPVPRSSAPGPAVDRATGFAVWAVDEVVAPIEGACPAGTVALAGTTPRTRPLQCFRRTTDGERLGLETVAAAAPLLRGRGANRAWYVAVTLTPDGLDRLNRLATAVRLGRGQLAVEYDGRVLTAPMLTSEPYRDATIDITGDVEESVARSIAAGLTPA